MKRFLLIVYWIVSFLFSLMVGSNVFANMLHHADILGRPQFGKFYEPLHLIYWYFTIHVTGNQYKVSFIVALVCFVLLSFLGFRLYTRLGVNVLGIYGTSRWMRRRELAKEGAFAARGVFLGQTKDAEFRKTRKGQYKLVSQGRVISDQPHTHVAVIAPTRGGKGVSCVVPTLLGWTHSAVINDPKKENYTLTSSWRNTFSNVYLFEPTSPESNKFNPFWEIRKAPYDVMDAQIIAEIITHPRGDSDYDNVGQNPHWVNTAKQLLIGAILYVLTEPKIKDKSLHGVANLLQSPTMPVSAVLQEMLQSDHMAVAETAMNMMNKHEEEMSGVVSTACEFLSLYQDPIVAYNTAYSDFTVEELTNAKHPASLYICTNPESQERLRPLVRLIIEFIAKRLTNDLARNSRPILFLLDEFISLGKFAFLQDWMAHCAQYRIKVMLIAQSFSQIYDKYGERSSLLNNCHTKAILGAGDPQDAKTVVEYLGSYSINRKNVSQSGTLGNIMARTRSESYIETERKLMTSDEVLRLPYEDFLLVTSGKFPYRGKKLMYYTDRRFTPKTDVKHNPPLPATRLERLKLLPFHPLEVPWLNAKALQELQEVYNQPSEKAISSLRLPPAPGSSSETAEPAAEAIPAKFVKTEPAAAPEETPVVEESSGAAHEPAKPAVTVESPPREQTELGLSVPPVIDEEPEAIDGENATLSDFVQGADDLPFDDE
jgi:type IV secretion system protein VirD4